MHHQHGVVVHLDPVRPHRNNTARAKRETINAGSYPLAQPLQSVVDSKAVANLTADAVDGHHDLALAIIRSL